MQPRNEIYRGVPELTPVVNVELHPTPNRISVAESHALFWVTGRGVRNRDFPHRVVRFAEEGLILSARAVVIGSHRILTEDYDAGTIAIGDTLTVDGVDYIVTARPLADPILIPA